MLLFPRATTPPLRALAGTSFRTTAGYAALCFAFYVFLRRRYWIYVRRFEIYSRLAVVVPRTRDDDIKKELSSSLDRYEHLFYWEIAFSKARSLR